MNRARGGAALVAAVLLMAGCSGNTVTTAPADGPTTGSTAVPSSPPPDSVRTGSPSPASPAASPSGRQSADQAAELAAARARWAKAGIRDYTLKLYRSCFCPVIGAVQVVVRDGRPGAPAAVPDGNNPSPTGAPADTPRTVEALFDVVAREQATAEKVVVQYDGSGVPTRIDSDRILNAVDDEENWTASVVAIGPAVAPGATSTPGSAGASTPSS